MPKGFELSSNDTANSIGEESAQNLMYSDGMVAFSVIVEPMPESLQEMSVETVSGATVVVSHTIQDRKGNPQFVTVVGDLPKNTIWRIARGVTFDP